MRIYFFVYLVKIIFVLGYYFFVWIFDMWNDVMLKKKYEWIINFKKYIFCIGIIDFLLNILLSVIIFRNYIIV